LGEADITFPKLIRLLEESGDISGIDGVAYLDGGEMVIRPNESYPHELDEIPMPAFGHWPATHRTIYREGVGATIEISRGCPFSCTFCVLPSFNKTYREKSKARVLEELKALKAMDVHEIFLADASVGIDPERTQGLFKEIAADDYSFEFIGFMRAGTVCSHPALIELMAEAGLKIAIVGFESYTEEGLSRIEKATSLETNREAARILRSKGIFVMGSHIYGLPKESYREALLTYRHGTKGCDQYMAGLFTPLPGSPLFNSLDDQNLLVSDEPDRINFSEYLVKGGPNPRLFRILSALLYLQYYLSPRRWGRALFGSPTMRMTLRSEYRLLFWRTIYSVLRRLGVKIL
ncbi:B12-binding domain-containing radical SAM protein, partial [Thermodesulfobacteriota bacterium]